MCHRPTKLWSKITFFFLWEVIAAIHVCTEEGGEVGVWGFPFCACHRAHLVWAPPCSLFPGQCTYPRLCVLHSVVATQLLVFWKDPVQQILNYRTSLSWKAYNVFFFPWMFFVWLVCLKMSVVNVVKGSMRIVVAAVPQKVPGSGFGFLFHLQPWWLYWWLAIKVTS